MKFFRAHNLVILMPLPGDQDHVTGPGRREGPADGTPPIRLHLKFPPLLPPSPGTAGKDLFDNGVGVPRAGVVAGDKGEVSDPGHLPSHEGTLGPVPIPSATEDNDQAP